MEYQRQAEVAPSLGEWTAAAGIAWPLGLTAVAWGVWSMKRERGTGAFLVAVGSATASLVVFWLILPAVIAISVSAYAIVMARRLGE